MLENKVQTNELFLKLKGFADALSLSVIEINKTVKSSTDVHISITVAKRNGDVSIDECETFHRSIQPVLELEFGREVLSLEVSTPGIQRAFKDVYELEVFEGKNCRLYSNKFSSWIEGVLGDCDSDCVKLLNYKICDTSETGESLNLNYSEIQKGKLEFKWETAEDKKRKNIEKQKLERRNKKVQENIKK